MGLTDWLTNWLTDEQTGVNQREAFASNKKTHMCLKNTYSEFLLEMCYFPRIGRAEKSSPAEIEGVKMFPRMHKIHIKKNCNKYAQKRICDLFFQILIVNMYFW